jgi:hypothetical protein
VYSRLQLVAGEVGVGEDEEAKTVEGAIEEEGEAK